MNHKKTCVWKERLNQIKTNNIYQIGIIKKKKNEENRHWGLCDMATFRAVICVPDGHLEFSKECRKWLWYSAFTVICPYFEVSQYCEVCSLVKWEWQKLTLSTLRQTDEANNCISTNLELQTIITNPTEQRYDKSNMIKNVSRNLSIDFIVFVFQFQCSTLPTPEHCVKRMTLINYLCYFEVAHVWELNGNKKSSNVI